MGRDESRPARRSRAALRPGSRPLACLDARVRRPPAPPRGDLGRLVHVHQDRGRRARADDDDVPAARLLRAAAARPRRLQARCAAGVGSAARDHESGRDPRHRQHRSAVHPDRLGRDANRLGRGRDRERVAADLRRDPRLLLPKERERDRGEALRGPARARGRRSPHRRASQGRPGGRRRDARRDRRIVCVRGRDALHAEHPQGGAERRPRRRVDHVGRGLAGAARDHPGAGPRAELGRDRERPGAGARRHGRRPAHLLPDDLQLRLRAGEPRRLPAARDRALLRRAAARRDDHRLRHRRPRFDPGRHGVWLGRRADAAPRAVPAAP